jgi:hypothetical protein
MHLEIPEIPSYKTCVVQPKSNKLSIENFLTEVLAYLVNTDRTFCRTFVQHVIPNRRMRRGFKYASALPQQTIGRGIAGLTLLVPQVRQIFAPSRSSTPASARRFRSFPTNRSPLNLPLG